MPTTTMKSMDLFFYIKNSADYPPGQILTDKFGYETSTSGDGDSQETTAVFNFTIKDLYNKLTTPKVVENLYQLNKIDGNVTLSNKSIFTTETEYTSVMVIDNGKQSDYADVNPDYNISDLSKYIDGSLDRSHVFWRKMFSLFEFLKYNELNIVNRVEPTGVNKDLLRSDTPNTFSIYNNENTVGKYILAFVANKNQFSSKETVQNAIYNDYRKTFFNPIYNDTWLYDGNDEKSDKLWQDLNISYNIKSASVTSSARYANRIDSIRFSIQYYDYKRDETQIWTFNLYLTPDAIIESKAGTSFEVWTYNDDDLDAQYKDMSGNFNKYDNDYANTLSSDERIKKSFIVTKTEMANQMAKKIIEITKSGLYSGYVEFNTTRVSPYIKPAESGTKASVVWDNNNRTIQTFLVFYTSSEPTSTEQQSAVQNYLRNLHKDCHPETVDSSGNVISIGHGTTPEELNLFLSKMYPELFSLSTVTIVPIISDRLNGTDVYDPKAYIHPVSVYDICRTVKSIPGFTNFGFNTDGSYQDESDNSRAGVEVFYLGGMKSSDNKILYDFPIICTRAGTSSEHPFTDIEGMKSYKQLEFNGNNVPEKSADLLQFILLRLFEKMFVKGTDVDKKHVGQVGEVMISYSYEGGYDANKDLFGKNVANIAKFTINSIEYTVYSQQGKNFGSLSTSESIGA